MVQCIKIQSIYILTVLHRVPDSVNIADIKVLIGDVDDSGKDVKSLVDESVLQVIFLLVWERVIVVAIMIII